jgi:hypothetical protein
MLSSPADALADTWVNLPAVTTPLVTVPVITPTAPADSAALDLRVLAPSDSMSDPVPTLPGDADPNSSISRWTRWGAATGGARHTITRRQARITLAVAAVLVLGLAIELRAGLILLLGLMTALYCVNGTYLTLLRLRAERAPRAAFKLGAAHLATGTPISGRTGRDEAGRDGASGGDDNLPLYSVLVPLHREGRILPYLVRRLQSLDYPTDRLEILLLIESDDHRSHVVR